MLCVRDLSVATTCVESVTQISRRQLDFTRLDRGRVWRIAPFAGGRASMSITTHQAHLTPPFERLDYIFIFGVYQKH